MIPITILEAAGGTKATGGIVTIDDGFIYHTFLATDTFIAEASFSGDVLIVAGGGGGGEGLTNDSRAAGGGGAGGYLAISSHSFSQGTNYNVTIGAGGAANTQGSNSTAFGYTAIGGGFGGRFGPSPSYNGGVGGSGGGSPEFRNDAVGGAGTSGQGNAGGGSTTNYQAGGGGGASQAGQRAQTSPAVTPGKGGDGDTWVDGQTYAGGGGGGADFDLVVPLVVGGAGGAGGGGQGGYGFLGITGIEGAPAQSGTVNTGSGGGGGGGDGGLKGAFAGAGGSGIVIVRYAI